MNECQLRLISLCTKQTQFSSTFIVSVCYFSRGTTQHSRCFTVYSSTFIVSVCYFSRGTTQHSRCFTVYSSTFIVSVCYFSRGTTQHSRCFTVYSFMVSIGGCVGYLITAVDWADNSLGAYLGGQERTVFMVLVVLFSSSALLTFGAATEKPLTADAVDPNRKNDIPLLLTSGESFKDDPFSSRKGDEEHNGYLSKVVSLPALNAAFSGMGSPRNVGPLTSALASLYARLRSSVPFRNLSNVPFVLRRLALANFCSWTAVMGFNLYFSDFVGQAVYGGDPSAAEGSELRMLYDRGVRIGSFGLLLHCVNSALYAGVIERIMARFDLRLTYAVGMLTFTVAMAIMAISQNVYVVCTMAAMTGVGYATLTTTPFMLVTIYHEDEKVSLHYAFT